MHASRFLSWGLLDHLTYMSVEPLLSGSILDSNGHNSSLLSRIYLRICNSAFHYILNISFNIFILSIWLFFSSWKCVVPNILSPIRWPIVIYLLHLIVIWFCTIFGSYALGPSSFLLLAFQLKKAGDVVEIIKFHTHHWLTHRLKWLRFPEHIVILIAIFEWNVCALHSLRDLIWLHVSHVWDK